MDNYFTQLGTDISQTVINLNSLVETATYYIWGSAIGLALVLIFVWALHTKIDELKKENIKLKNQLELIIENQNKLESLIENRGINKNGKHDECDIEGNNSSS